MYTPTHARTHRHTRVHPSFIARWRSRAQRRPVQIANSNTIIPGVLARSVSEWYLTLRILGSGYKSSIGTSADLPAITLFSDDRASPVTAALKHCSSLLAGESTNPLIIALIVNP